MQIKIELPIKCSNVDSCMESIVKAMKTIVNFEESGKRTAHYEITHGSGIHTLCLFVYENNGKHESDGKITDEAMVKKSSKFPNQTDLEAALHAELLKNPNITFI